MTNFAEQLQAGCDHLARRDDKMAALIAIYGLPTFAPSTQHYQMLVTSIISQQVSVKAAATVRGRFVDLFGYFPAAGEVLAYDSDALRAIGLSGRKVLYIRDLSSRVLDGLVNFSHFDSATNDEIIAELTTVKGIGLWTAQMFLLFCLGRLNVLADGDLGIKNAVTHLYDFPVTCTSADIQSVSLTYHWQPYASIACWYAWRSLDNKTNV